MYHLSRHCWLVMSINFISQLCSNRFLFYLRSVAFFFDQGTFPFPRRESHWHGQYKDNTSVCLCSNLILFLYLSLQYTTRITLTCSNAIFFLLLGYLICEPLFNKRNFFFTTGVYCLTDMAKCWHKWPKWSLSLSPNSTYSFHLH